MFWTKNISSVSNIKCTRNQIGIFFQPKRWKNEPKNWDAIKKKNAAINKALEHFDDFYGSVYGKKWSSIRVALLSPQKYCAIVNNFGNDEATTALLESEGAFNLKRSIEIYKPQVHEKNKINKRVKDLKNVFELDRKVEYYAEKTKQEELQNLYPENTDISSETTNNVTQVSSEEEIDQSRQIDSKTGLTGAALYDFVPATELKGREDFILESEHYSYYDKFLKIPVEYGNEDKLTFPEHLQVYSFETSNMSYFQEPQRGSTGVLNYYLMNASSLLPVLALNLSPGDSFLDMCAAPGGKSIVALQTLYPDLVVCNDKNRAPRLKRVLQDYFYDLDKRVKITARDGRIIDESDVFNKILVDVPCTNDRLSVVENDNNIFKPNRLKDRLRLPEMQADLLSNALKLVKVGGTVVYSTCSLSPIQNDGVVQMALRRIWEETRHKFFIKNMEKVLEPYKLFFRFSQSSGVKYGHIVLPYLPANFGPLYFCKLVRLE